MNATKCIWCLGITRGSHIEHIVPEALGCPPGFVLSSEVICQSCNNKLGHLDQAVINDFDFISFNAGIPRKKGRPASITSRGNVYGYRSKSGPEIHFNMESFPVVANDGTLVAPFRGSERNIKGSFEKFGPYAQISFETKFATTKKFHRGIYKIALSALVYFVGPNELLKFKYDTLRQYVRKGSGTRHIMLLVETAPNEYYHQFDPPFKSPANDYALSFRLACVRFIIDLSESEIYLPKFVEEAQRQCGESGWTIMPLF